MVRNLRKPEVYHTFIFEITDWDPSYLLSVNTGKHDDPLYWESLSVRIAATCVFPPMYAGRLTGIHLFCDRNMLKPEILKYDKEWKPRCVGSLRVEAGKVHYDAALPHDFMPTLLAMLSSECNRYILLHGETVSRGKSLCRSFEIQRTVNLDDYSSGSVADAWLA